MCALAGGQLSSQLQCRASVQPCARTCSKNGPVVARPKRTYAWSRDRASRLGLQPARTRAAGMQARVRTHMPLPRGATPARRGWAVAVQRAASAAPHARNGPHSWRGKRARTQAHRASQKPSLCASSSLQLHSQEPSSTAIHSLCWHTTRSQWGTTSLVAAAAARQCSCVRAPVACRDGVRGGGVGGGPCAAAPGGASSPFLQLARRSLFLLQPARRS